MATLKFNTAKELKKFVSENRKEITNINGVDFNEMYPMLEVSNKHASYYNVEEQGNSGLYAPFTVIVK